MNLFEKTNTPPHEGRRDGGQMAAVPAEVKEKQAFRER